MPVLPTVLVLDMHDSYTRNVLALFSQLVNSGGPTTGDGATDATWSSEGWQDRVVVVNVDSLSWDLFVSDVLPSVSCIILGPGPGSPHKTEDFSWPTRLIQEYGHQIPILGLCLGHQGLATAFGGAVVKAPTPRHGQVSRIRHTNDALFSGVPAEFHAIQYNSLVVSHEGLPSDLEVTAWAKNEGHENIMALRHRSQPLWGLQFHPESISSSYGATLLSNFLSLASQHESRSGRAIDPALRLPLSVLALTTSYKRGLPNSVPDVPRLFPDLEGGRKRWEQRSVLLGPGALPQEVFEGLVKASTPLGEIWLDSARPTGLPQYSHLIAPSLSWSYSIDANTIDIRTAHSSSTVSIRPPQTFFTTVASAQDTLKRLTTIADPMSPSVPIGFVGYLGYEMKEIALPHCQSLSRPGQTDAEFAFASTVLSFEHDTGLWRATALVRTSNASSEADTLEAALSSSFGIEEEDWKVWIAKGLAFFASPHTPSPWVGTVAKLETMAPDLDEWAYVRAIDHARALITSGESYELCLTTQFRCKVPDAVAKDPYDLYLALRASNPAPYSSYFRLPKSNISLLSSSPERFMYIHKDRNVEMKPIKGTVRRSDDPVEDRARKESLEKDEKERAENLMIVDLCRNDLLGFCEVDTVRVPKLMVVESFKTVHQLVTSVVGTLTPVVNPFEAVARAFPPGSMTGAPKLRSVKLLEQLESSVPRGVYSGVFGFVAVDGTTDFSVVIRTLVIKGSDLTLGAGGAITHLSEPSKEWDEVLVKKEAVVGRL